MSGQVRTANSYFTKLSIGGAFLTLLVVAASANTYANLAPQLSASARADLLSGLVSIVFVFVIASLFLAATIGRESLVSLNTLSARARQMERGDLDVDLETSRTDEIGELYKSFAAVRDALRARIRETERKSERLRSTAQRYGQTMNEVGDGDLSKRLDENVEEPVMANLATEFNHMMDRLEQTVAEVYSFTDEVATASTALAQHSRDSMRASVRIHRAAQEIATDRQTQESLEQLESVDVDPDTVEAGLSVDGPETDDLELAETLDSIDGLSDRMDRIDEMSEFISRVANETNMLALNAGIEASKVDGDGAEGFQVVADEVKNLAEETENSAREIEDITEDIRDGTSDAVSRILKQQAALLSIMTEQVDDLSTASEDLRLTLSQLNVSVDQESFEPSVQSVEQLGEN